MIKPAIGSDDMLTGKRLFAIMKTKEEWTSSELLDSLLLKYTKYDREGLGHRIRQILSEYTKKGLLTRVKKGTYTVT
jgi:predicted transcriptional regulator of viral defense system